jgi:RNA polymerase sigma-B factor
VPDIASRLSITEEEVVEGLLGAQVYQSISLSTPLSHEGLGELGDFIGSCDHGYELIEIRMVLRGALAELGERDLTILNLRFYGNLTQKQIAARLGISQMHVSRLLTMILARLRRLILMEVPFTHDG